MKLTIWWSWVHSPKTWVHELVTYPWTPLPHIAFKNASWTSLVLQWLTIHLPMQETWVLSLLQEDSTCCGAPKPMLHNYWAYALEPTVQFSSVIQSCLTLFDPVDSSTPGFPVHHQLPELAQTHVHPVSGAIQPSRPLSSPSPPAFNLSQHQGLF